MDELPDTLTILSKFQEHSSYVQEIRQKCFSIILFFITGALLGFFLNDKIILYGLKLFNLKGVNIVMTSPFQFVGLSFTISLLCGLLTALPALTYQLLIFMKPALRKEEYHLLLKVIPWSILLFISGFIFGLWIMHFIILIYANASSTFQVGSFWDIQKLFSTILMTATFLGIIFQFPIILTILLQFRLIHRTDLIKKRKLIYVLLLFFVILLPPTDFFSDIILISPMILLFELTLLINFKNN